MNFVVVVKTLFFCLFIFVNERGWCQLRFLFLVANNYNCDYYGETVEGLQWLMFNVFYCDLDVICYFWGSEFFYAMIDDDEDLCYVGIFELFWNFFDLIFEGCLCDWYEQLSY